MQYVLVGNFGVGNVGDEAIKQYYLERFPEVEWKILSAQPLEGEYYRFPLGLRSLFTPWWKTIGVLRRSQGMVFGGGSLFTDTESIEACYLWGWHAKIARFFEKPVFLAFQGIGPFQKKRGEKITKSVIKNAQFVSVRDEKSRARVLELGYTKVIQTFDPVTWLFSQYKSDVRTKNVLVFIPRKNSGEAFKKAAHEAYTKHQNLKVAIVLMEPDASEEKMFADELQKEFPSSQIFPMRTIQELKDILSSAAHVVSERYHGIIPALGMGIPFDVVIQKEGDKLSTLRDLIKQGGATEKLLADVDIGYMALKTALGL